jgi:hypothetical protein
MFNDYKVIITQILNTEVLGEIWYEKYKII